MERQQNWPDLWAVDVAIRQARENRTVIDDYAAREIAYDFAQRAEWEGRPRGALAELAFTGTIDLRHVLDELGAEYARRPGFRHDLYRHLAEYVGHHGYRSRPV